MPTPSANKILCVDLALSQRLERAEGLANRRYIEAKQKAFPDTDAAWTTVGGAYAMFDTAQSPLTQTFGLGIFENPTDDDLIQIEQFFADRNAPVFHEISPLPDQALLARLRERGYYPIELTNILCRPVADIEPFVVNPKLSVRQPSKDEQETYCKLAAEAWQLPPEFAPFFEEMGRVSAANDHVASFIVELEGKPIGCGALCLSDDVALIAGDCTLPEARGHGAQQALIAARVAYAKQHGFNLMMMGAQPGSTSQKNGQRTGLQIAYTRIKWQKST
jgi:GNAT superfamily N-acetyltransferase